MALSPAAAGTAKCRRAVTCASPGSTPASLGITPAGCGPRPLSAVCSPPQTAGVPFFP